MAKYCVTIDSPSGACQLYLTVFRFCLFCDYHNCGSSTGKPQFPWLFPDECEVPGLFQIFQVGGRPANYCLLSHTAAYYITSRRSPGGLDWTSDHPRSRGRRRRRWSGCRQRRRHQRDIDSAASRRSSCLCVGCNTPPCWDTPHHHDHQRRTT